MMLTAERENEILPLPIEGLMPTREWLTVEKAKAWLQRVGSQRKVCRGDVVKYAEDMKHGEWLLNPADNIVFDTLGRLRNGQHRCEAVVLSGVPIEVYVVRGATEAQVLLLDTGRKRTQANQLDILRPELKETEPKLTEVMTAVWTLVYHYVSGKNEWSVKMGPAERAKRSAFDILCEESSRIASSFRGKQSAASPKVVGAFLYLCSSAGYADNTLLAYLDTAVKGIGAIDGTVEYLVNTKLRNCDAGGSPGTMIRLNILLKGFLLHTEKKNVRDFRATESTRVLLHNLDFDALRTKLRVSSVVSSNGN